MRVGLIRVFLVCDGLMVFFMCVGLIGSHCYVVWSDQKSFLCRGGLVRRLFGMGWSDQEIFGVGWSDKRCLEWDGLITGHFYLYWSDQSLFAVQWSDQRSF